MSQETNAEVLWEKLRSSYERKTAQNKSFITRKLVNLKLKKGKSIAEHISEFQDLVNKMVTMKLVIDDELQAILLLSSLPDRLETLAVSLSNSTSNGVLQLAMVKDSLLNEETRRKDIAHALVIETRGRSKSRSSKGQGKSRSRSESKGKFKCFCCDKEGHIKRNCKAWKNKQKEDKNKKKVDDENTTTVIVLEAIRQDDYCTVSDPYVEWVIDSAASCHVSPRNELFTS